ncbi:MAG: hypothetical protein V2I37_07865 [Marinilabiliaceae bacterium]|jgi:hypothetical protein|nr:hypothetical protein [Marinilabiliaceae bacterium]
MNKLSDKQISDISDRLAQSNIKSGQLLEDLTDHICCLIEDDLIAGKNFEEAEKRAFNIVFPGGMENDYSKSIIILSSRRARKMKPLIFILLYLGLIIMTFSFMFKALHWPGAGIMLMAACTLFTFIFTPVFFMYLYRSKLARVITSKGLYIFGFSGIVILLAGVAMKVFHLAGASITILAGLPIINFVFLPLIFSGFYRSSKNRTLLGTKLHRLLYISGYLASSLFLFADFFKLMHWPASEVLLISSIVIFNFGVLSLIMIKLYRKT